MPVTADSILLHRLLSRCRIVGETGCWEWQKNTSKGYGRPNWGRTMYAHIEAYRILVAEPDGLCVLHRCDNRRCVNPQHLFLGTKGDNNRDRRAKNRDGDHKGVRNGRAVLADDAVRDIRRKHRPVYGSLSALASEYGVTPTMIRNIVTGKAWTHVGGGA